MHVDDATGTTTTGISGPEPGTDATDIPGSGEPGPEPVGGASEPSSVRDSADSAVGETVGTAVPGRSTTDETGQRPDAASTDEDRAASGQRATGSTANWLKETEKTMATLLEILKAQGATDADLELMKPLLGNQKFAGAIEAEITAKAEWERKAGEASGKLTDFESQKNVAEVAAAAAAEKIKQYDEWYANQATPGIQKLQQENIREAERRAAAEARLAKAQEVYGFTLAEENPTVITTPAVTPATPPAAVAAPRQDLPDLSKYVTTDALSHTAEAAGQAIAQTQDLAWEHQQLFGHEKPINFSELRTKAIAEHKTFREIWERETNAPARRQELQAKRESDAQAKRDAEIAAARQEGYEKGMSQSINPMTREPQNSRFGVSFTKRDESAGKPWDAASSRSQDRLQKVVSTLAKQGAA